MSNQDPAAALQTTPLTQNGEDPITEAIGKVFEQFGIKNAVAVFELDGGKQQGVFYTGHFYEAAKLMARAHSGFSNQIAKDLHM